MHVPTTEWTAGGWNTKLSQFHRLAEMTGMNHPSSPEDLQDLFQHVAGKEFADNVQTFMDAVDGPKKAAADRLEQIEQRLGLMEPIPFMSLRGLSAPKDFEGVAIWPTGTANWIQLRLDQIRMSQLAGARFKHVVCLHSSRRCANDLERTHPLIAGIPFDQSPTEQAVQYSLVHSGAHDPALFRFAELPDTNDAGKPLSLEQQLAHLKASGQYGELIGDADIYVPSTPNSLYVPLHVRRLLGRDNVWFSQAGGRLFRRMPDYYWSSAQNLKTLPSGIIRLWIELVEAECITTW